MSKKSKRLRDMRRNPHKVRYDDLIGVLQDYGFTIRDRTGSSHVFVSLNIGDHYWSSTVVKPHGDAQYVNETGMRKLLKQFNEIDSVLAQIAVNEGDTEDTETGDNEDD